MGPSISGVGAGGRACAVPIDEVNKMNDKTKPDGKGDPRFTVNIIYNGVVQQIEVNPKQSTQALLAHALNAFGNPAGEHALFNEAGAELSAAKVEDTGLAAGARLILRPRVVRGG
jgi:hypothetical protein